jgi:hypothetical protein
MGTHDDAKNTKDDFVCNVSLLAPRAFVLGDHSVLTRNGHAIVFRKSLRHGVRRASESLGFQQRLPIGELGELGDSSSSSFILMPRISISLRVGPESCASLAPQRFLHALPSFSSSSSQKGEEGEEGEEKRSPLLVRVGAHPLDAMRQERPRLAFGHPMAMGIKNNNKNNTISVGTVFPDRESVNLSAALLTLQGAGDWRKSLGGLATAILADVRSRSTKKNEKAAGHAAPAYANRALYCASSSSSFSSFSPSSPPDVLLYSAQCAGAVSDTGSGKRAAALEAALQSERRGKKQKKTTKKKAEESSSEGSSSSLGVFRDFRPLSLSGRDGIDAALLRACAAQCAVRVVGRVGIRVGIQGIEGGKEREEGEREGEGGEREEGEKGLSLSLLGEEKEKKRPVYVYWGVYAVAALCGVRSSSHLSSSFDSDSEEDEHHDDDDDSEFRYFVLTRVRCAEKYPAAHEQPCGCPGCAAAATTDRPGAFCWPPVAVDPADTSCSSCSSSSCSCVSSSSEESALCGVLRRELFPGRPVSDVRVVFRPQTHTKRRGEKEEEEGSLSQKGGSSHEGFSQQSSSESHKRRLLEPQELPSGKRARSERD